MMLNKPSEARLRQLPGLYETENIPARDKIMHLHFFLGDSHWFAAEFGGEDLFFGFAVLGGDMQNAEWGYFSLAELDSVKVLGVFPVICDLNWRPVPAGEIGVIKDCL